MNPRKGDRERLTLRVPPSVADGLRQYCTERHLDGISEAVSELYALRGDRDKELEDARRHVAEARLQFRAAMAVAKEGQAEVRALRKAGAKRNLRKAKPHRGPVLLPCVCGEALDPPFSDLSGRCAACRGRLVAELQASGVSA